MARLLDARRGGVALFAGLGLPIFLGLSAFAVDLGSMAFETRRLQGLADAAALAAASDTANANARASGVINAAHWPRTIAAATVTGGYSADAALPPASRFVAGSGSDAARVTLTTQSPAYFARMFGLAALPISRSAIAAQQKRASFSIGSRLASINGGLLNNYLSALTGSSIALTALDYNGLAGADVDLLGMLDAAKISAGIGDTGYASILGQQLPIGQLLTAAASATGDAASAAALNTLATQAGNRTVALGTLFDLGSDGGAGAGAIHVNALSLVSALLQLASANHQISFDSGVTVPGLASLRLTLAVGDRPAQSPWLTVTDRGTPVIRTAQARLYAEATLAGSNLPGIGGLIGIKLPIYIELASAEARLNAIDCGTPGGVTIDARPNPGVAAIATVNAAALGDFGSQMTLGNARLVDTLLIDVYGRAVIDTGAAEPWQQLWFDTDTIAAGGVRRVESSHPVAGVAASLVSNLTMTVSVLGLPISTGPLTSAVGTALAGVAPAIDTLLDSATGAIGVHYGEADVRVTGRQCGRVALVG